MGEIGFLRDIAAREAWPHEAIDFTPWLAENLGVLGAELGVQLEFESKETSVGSYYADIVARCPQDDRVVLIENQLEKSDHGHLGQVMTYIAGTDAQIIVWIATEFSEPHLAAIKWLNEHTVDPFAFFAVRLRVVRIGESDPAPMFEVLARPNQWERQMHAAQREKRTQSGRAEFRSAFWESVLSHSPDLFVAQSLEPNGAASQWLTCDRAPDLVVSIYISLTGVGVFLRGRRGSTPAEVFELFEPKHENFKALVENEMYDPDTSRHPGWAFHIDMTDRDNWDEAVEWLCRKARLWLEATDTVFGEDI